MLEVATDVAAGDAIGIGFRRLKSGGA